MKRSWLGVAALACTFSALVPSLGAQTTGLILGTAYDSLRRAPLGGAEIQVRGTPRRVIADSTGRFRFDAVAPGAYTLELTHPALDAAGIYVLTAQAAVEAARPAVIQLASPSLTTVWQRVCGRPTPFGTSDTVLWSQGRGGSSPPFRTNPAPSSIPLDSRDRASVAIHACGAMAAWHGTPRHVQFCARSPAASAMDSHGSVRSSSRNRWREAEPAGLVDEPGEAGEPSRRGPARDFPGMDHGNRQPSLRRDGRARRAPGSRGWPAGRSSSRGEAQDAAEGERRELQQLVQRPPARSRDAKRGFVGRPEKAQGASELS